jgi:GTPase involved in cell partitioning and DNA repair
MKSCLVVGKPNAGKTAFALSFAAYLGLTSVSLRAVQPGGATSVRTLMLADARRNLIAAAPHHTTCLQSLEITLPAGKGRRSCELVDSTGLVEQIHESDEVRRGMAQTLRSLSSAAVVLHLIDASRADRPGAVEALSDLDREVARFVSGRTAYAILASKMDLPGARDGLGVIRASFPQQRVIPVSAVRRWGLGEVRAFVARAI